MVYPKAYFLRFFLLSLACGVIGWNVYNIILKNTDTTGTKNSSHQHNTEQKRIITVTHHINNETLGYQHWTGTYHPTTFVIHANDIHLDEENKPFKIEITDNTLAIRFDYAFLNGKRKGAKSILFDIPDQLEQCDITFDWKDEWQMLVEGADPIEVIKKEFNEDLPMEIKL